MQHQQIPFFHVGGDIQVQRCRLVDIRRAVGGQFNQPALIDFEAGFERVFFLGREEIEMLNAATLFKDAVPHIIAILALFDQQFLKMRIAD